MTLSNKDIANIIIGDILTEALEDEFGTTIQHRIFNHLPLEKLTEEERDDIYANNEDIELYVKDAIHNLNTFIASVGA